MTAIVRFNDPLIAEIQKHIITRMERIKEELASNGAADFSAYRYKTGQYDGLQQALFSLEDAVKHYGIDDDLEKS